MSLVRWTAVPGDASPDDGFLERFHRCGEALRFGYAPDRPVSRTYTETVLRVGLRRPGELLVAHGSGGDLARAALFRCGSPEGAGAVGLYEAEAGPEGDAATRELLHAALDWAHAEGLGELYAPVDANTWFSYRFTLPDAEGSAAPPVFGWEPLHPPDYLERFRRHGFETFETYESRGMTFARAGSYTARSMVEHTRAPWASARDAGYRIERLDGRVDVGAFLDELYALCMDAFRENTLFEPIPPELFTGLYGEVLAGAPGHVTFYARDGEGRLRGFVFTFPDRGALVVKTIAVAPDVRGEGLSSALMHAVFRTAVEDGVDAFVPALIRKGNRSLFLVEPHMMPGVDTWVRGYVLLRRAVAP